MATTLDYRDDLIWALRSLDVTKLDLTAKIVDKAVRSLDRIFIAGNGGGHAVASHAVTDFQKGLLSHADIVCPMDNTAWITAYSNDIGYNGALASYLESRCSSLDLVILLSGSGNSRNMLEAANKANEIGAVSISVTGMGGLLSSKTTHHVDVLSKDMQIIEDCFSMVIHYWFKYCSQDDT